MCTRQGEARARSQRCTQAGVNIGMISILPIAVGSIIGLLKSASLFNHIAARVGAAFIVITQTVGTLINFEYSHAVCPFLQLRRSRLGWLMRLAFRRGRDGEGKAQIAKLARASVHLGRPQCALHCMAVLWTPHGLCDFALGKREGQRPRCSPLIK